MPLSWFVPLAEVTAYSDPQHTHQLKRLSLSILNLNFNVVDVKGEKRAYSEGHYPGYYISPEQKDPRLTAYSSRMLLQHQSGEKKVLLPVSSLNGKLFNVLIGKREGIIEAFANQLFAGILESKLDLFSEKVYAYTFDRSGRLTSDKFEPVLFLLITHLMEGDHQLVQHYLALLEGLGRREPISMNVLKSLCRKLQVFSIYNNAEGPHP